MFSTFTTRGGRTLIIRAIDVRSFEDASDGGSTLSYEPSAGKLILAAILGTAEENLNRLKQEETDALIAAEKLRQRQASGYPAEPISRGKQAIRMVPK